MSQLYSVSQLVKTIKYQLESTLQFQSLSCKGEITNLTIQRSGHWYFSLKDNEAKINCVMFLIQNKRLMFKPKDGDQVTVTANVTVYPPTGQLQLSVMTMVQTGQGELYQQYLMLRKKLHQEGYFDLQHKKTIPKYPEKIGVIVGENSAAQADIYKTISTRWPLAEIKWYFSLVQGNQASEQLITKLKQADQDQRDVLILARGGGSIEDLWAFNNEELVKTIYALKTPIVSGVGHEIDITLVDYVVDQRGVTPTHAAQLVTPDQNDVLQDIETLHQQLIQKQQLRLSHLNLALNSIMNTSFLKKPLEFLNPQFIQLQFLNTKLVQSMNQTIQKTALYHHKMVGCITLTNQKIIGLKQEVNSLQKRLIKVIQSELLSKQQLFELAKRSMMLVSPQEILKKGYTLTHQNNTLIKRANELNSNQPITITYYDESREVILYEKNKDI